MTNPDTAVTKMRFRKKPVVIEAMQYPGHSVTGVDNLLAFEDWFHWFHGAGGTGRYIGDKLHVTTLEDGPNGEAIHVADPGDWIIRGVKGELYPCKPDIFAATYEPADTPAVSQGRACLFCGTPIHECMGFTLARDVLAATEGSKSNPREMCFKCADLVSELFLKAVPAQDAGITDGVVRAAAEAATIYSSK